MWSQTILLGEGLRHKVQDWANDVPLPEGDAIAQLVSDGLARPVVVKDAFERYPLRPPGRAAPSIGGRVTVRLPKNVATGVEAHRVRYGLRTPSAAVRELLWLGLGKVPPQPIEGRADFMRWLAANGERPGEIAARLGVSRQAVHAALKVGDAQ